MDRGACWATVHMVTKTGVIKHAHMHLCSIVQLCPTLCDPIDCSRPVYTHTHVKSKAKYNRMISHGIPLPPELIISILGWQVVFY